MSRKGGRQYLAVALAAGVALAISAWGRTPVETKPQTGNRQQLTNSSTHLRALSLIDMADLTGNDPDGVSLTFEGCRNDGSTSLPNASGDFICPDSAYTTGNLGKGWNELDLVPYRLTSSTGNQSPTTQTYDVTIVLDNRAKVDLPAARSNALF